MKLSGSFLRSTRRNPSACSKCAGELTNSQYSICYGCWHVSAIGLPDSSGFITYAAKGSQAGAILHAYKTNSPSSQARGTVVLLLALGLKHLECCEKIAGQPVTHWSYVPSTSKNRPNGHPLYAILRHNGSLSNILYHPIKHNLKYNKGEILERQTLYPDLFLVKTLPTDSHVLLIDDTWVSGTRAYSAIASIRSAQSNESKVSVLCAGRWLKFDPTSPTTSTDLALDLKSDSKFNAQSCPFTGGACP